jgi:hypothetical protein
MGARSVVRRQHLQRVQGRAVQRCPFEGDGFHRRSQHIGQHLQPLGKVLGDAAARHDALRVGRGGPQLVHDAQVRKGDAFHRRAEQRRTRGGAGGADDDGPGGRGPAGGSLTREVRQDEWRLRFGVSGHQLLGIDIGQLHGVLQPADHAADVVDRAAQQ